MCGATHKVCASSDTGFTLSEIETAGDYPLFFCDTPANEPTCIPSRPGEYDGSVTGEDADGDGIGDSEDICPAIFNPKRPLSSNAQPNFDEDDFGDSCDECAVSAQAGACGAFDLDTDGVDDEVDNCPTKMNADQSDRDNDQIGDVCDACPDDANPDGAGCPATIYAINKGEVAEGTAVRISGAVVTATGKDGAFIRVPASSPTYDGIDYSGLFVYAPDATVSAGDLVDVDGTIGEFRGGRQLDDASFDVVGTTEVPAPIVVTDVSDILRTGAKGEAYDGLVVTVSGLTVSNIEGYEMYKEVATEQGIYIDDILFAFDEPQVGQTYSSVTGGLAYRDFSGTAGVRIAPRSADDLSTGPPTLEPFAKARYAVEAGGSADITLILSSAVAQDTTVALSYGAPNVTGPATVTVAQGSDRVTFSITGGAASSSATGLTAQLDGVQESTEVLVYDATTPRTITSITPSSVSLRPNTQAAVTLQIDVPASASGLTLDIVTTGAISAPSTVMVMAGDDKVDVIVSAGASEGMGSFTASIGGGAGLTITVVVAASSGAPLFLSEVVEGASNNKAVEIFNNSSAPIDLSGYGLCLYSNADTSCSRHLILSGTLAPGQVYVVCNSGIAGTSACDINDNAVINFNGDDRIELFADLDGSGDRSSADATADAFGILDTEPDQDPWKDQTFDRCNFTAFDGTGASFTPSLFFNVLAKDTLTGLGVAPTAGCP